MTVAPIPPQWPLDHLVGELRAMRTLACNEAADRLEALTAEVAKLRDDIGPGVTGAELRALVYRERAAPRGVPVSVEPRYSPNGQRRVIDPPCVFGHKLQAMECPSCSETLRGEPQSKEHWDWYRKRYNRKQASR